MFVNTSRDIHTDTNISGISQGKCLPASQTVPAYNNWQALISHFLGKKKSEFLDICILSIILFTDLHRKDTQMHTHSIPVTWALWLFQRYNEIIVASWLNGPASQIRRRHHVPVRYALAANVSVHDAPCVLVYACVHESVCLWVCCA